MSVQADEIERRKQVALVAIRDSFGTEEDDYSVTLFVSHHLEELDASYWLSRLGIADPDPEKVISLLELYSHWGEKDEDGIDVFDFTLPGKVTNYMISVRFDAMGSIEDISMEC